METTGKVIPPKHPKPKTLHGTRTGLIEGRIEGSFREKAGGFSVLEAKRGVSFEVRKERR